MQVEPETRPTGKHRSIINEADSVPLSTPGRHRKLDEPRAVPEQAFTSPEDNWVSDQPSMILEGNPTIDVTPQGDGPTEPWLFTYYEPSTGKTGTLIYVGPSGQAQT